MEAAIVEDELNGEPLSFPDITNVSILCLSSSSNEVNLSRFLYGAIVLGR